MKIVISGRYILPKMEGVGRYTKEVVSHLVRQYPEHEYHVVLDRNYRPGWLEDLDIRLHILSPQARHPILWRLWYEWRWPRLVKKISPDVIFYPEAYLSRMTKVPAVMTVHDLAYMHRLESMFASHLKYLKKNFPLFIQRAESLIAVSEYTKSDLKDSFTSSSQKTHVIYHGVGPEFKPTAKEKQHSLRTALTGGAPYFLFLGAMHPRKNVIRLIEAFERLKKEHDLPHFLILAGRLAWKSNAIKEKMETSVMKDYIIYESDIDDKLIQMIGTAEAMCYVSLLEGFGLPVLEAMACGTPVITSKESAMEEVCATAAAYVDPYDVEAISTAMLKIAINSDLRKRLVADGLQRAKKFNWENTAHQIHDVLAQTASK